MIGMPGSFAAWEGNAVSDQLDWLVKDWEVGVGIKDASMENPAWQTAAVWRKLATIRSAAPAPKVKLIAIPAGAPAPQGRFDTAGRERNRTALRFLEAAVSGGKRRVTYEFDLRTNCQAGWRAFYHSPGPISSIGPYDRNQAQQKEKPSHLPVDPCTLCMVLSARENT